LAGQNAINPQNLGSSCSDVGFCAQKVKIDQGGMAGPGASADYYLRSFLLAVSHNSGGYESDGCVRARLSLHSSVMGSPLAVAVAAAPLCPGVNALVEFDLMTPYKVADGAHYWIRLETLLSPGVIGSAGSANWLRSSDPNSYNETGTVDDTMVKDPAQTSPAVVTGDFYFKAFKSEEVCNSAKQCVD
jgi:hypothetical protein